ncbi:hypothetical protein ACTJI2_06400 [Pseudoxanthomonas sp. 22568]|uniref:hypothetical protein n=1 Tax=Pseudoxanthomonas sp. 22568 TaxID=3453945 RepID=UPI00296E8EC8|nr:hypothetical protein LAG73_05935 [Pseudoxanthomonas japonensis]
MEERPEYSKILGFIEENGKFVNENFPETALSRQDALVFLNLLHVNRVRPLGIELWRHSSSGYAVDGAKGWYAEKMEVDADYEDAVSYMNSAWIKPDDLFVMQY